MGDDLPDDAPAFMTVVGSVSAADVDGDGWTDAFVGDVGENSLYRNLGNGTFREVTARAGVAGGDNFTTDGLWFDWGGDGDLDLFVVNYGDRARLYRNDGGWSFTEVAREAGVANATWAYEAAAADVDGDGDLDLTVGNYQTFGGGLQASPYANATNGQRDLLHVNQGNGTFREEGLERGLTATRWTFSHAFADHDRDGDPDLYANVDFGYDVLYANDGAGNFTPVTRQAGTVTNANGMGAVWADVDGDLDLDLLSSNIYLPGHHGIEALDGNDLFLRGPDDTYREAARERGVADGGWGWDPQPMDVDLDGDVDLLQANGEHSAGSPDLFYNSTPYLTTERPQPEPGVEYATVPKYNATHWLVLELREGFEMSRNYSVGGYQQDRVFLNHGNGTFAEQDGARGIDGWADSRAYASLDVDHDGDLDVLRTATGRTVELHRNGVVDGDGSGEGRHWLQLELRSDPPNTRAVGARVAVEAGNLSVLRQVASSGGFMSHDPPGLVHVGLGDHEVADEVTVTWPDGEETRLEDVAADRRLRLTRGQGTATLWTG